MKLLREWGFPIGLAAFWIIAVAYTLNALAGLSTTRSLPVMRAPVVVIDAPRTAHAS
jgi:hypothetical protein